MESYFLLNGSAVESLDLSSIQKGNPKNFVKNRKLEDYSDLRSGSSPNLWDKFSGREWIEVLALIGMVVGVIWAGYAINAGVNDVDEKVDGIGSTVSEIKGVVEKNEIRLDNIEESVSDVRREVSSTKDVLNELRVETAQQGNNKSDE